MPRSVPAAPKDFFHQYGLGTGAGSASDGQVRLVVRYGGLLEPSRLERAIAAVVRGDPMLRARLVETGPCDGHWEERSGEGMVPTCPIREVADPEPAIAAFLADTAVRDEGPYFQVLLVRARGRDALCLRVDHRLCDGAGTKIIAYRISEAYRNLAVGAPLPAPCPELPPRTLAGLSRREPPPPPPSPGPPPEERFSYAVPRRGFSNEAPAHAVRVLDAATVAAARHRGKALGATLNDLLLTAFERALDPLRVSPAVRFARQPPVPASPAERDATFVLLSNLGIIDAARLELGEPPLLDAQLMGPVALLREILVSASSFRGALTLAIGYCRSDVDATVPEGILDRMAAELRAFAAAE